MLKMIIFDMDGVLVDACGWHKDALNEALEEVADFRLTEEEHEKHFNGLPTMVKLENLVKMGEIKPEHVQLVYELKQEKTKKVILENASLDRSKTDMMAYLEENNIIVCCFTNSIRETALMMLEKTGIKNYLRMIVTNQEVSQAKPHPEGYIKILESFDISPEEAFIVEDSPKGIKAAEASGCKVMKVKNATHVNTNSIKEFINESFNSNGR
jgi:beta-phosphoglucomutase|tara:strand:- start:2052 stop:2687 length:636 start_codon:yes stop_codon:yes gene_type:complete